MPKKRLAAFYDAILVPASRAGHTPWAGKVAFSLLLLVFISFLLAACSLSSREDATPTTPAGTPIPSPTLVPAATLTPLPPRAVLLAPEGSDEALAQSLEAAMSDLASQDDMQFERVMSLSPADLTSDLSIVVALAPDPGLTSMVASAPGTQFLALGIPDLQPTANLSVIAGDDERADRQGFLAGYLASVVTKDWRVGVIGLGDSPAGMAARNGFVNGAIYYCGLCRPAYPPFNEYPVYYDLPSGAAPSDQQAAADALIAQGVTTIYVTPGAGDTALLEYLSTAGINLIGGIALPDSVREHWISTIQPDWVAAVQEAWPDLVMGKAVDIQALPVQMIDINRALFSPGRQQWVEQTRINLNVGLIDTGIDLATGEKKQ